MSILRFLAYFFSALSLTILISCSSPTVSSNAGSSSPPQSAARSATESSHASHKGKQINLNSAILSELDKLEAKLGIPALSNKIQSSRPYGQTNELVSKNVINQAQFDQIKDMVTIEEIQLTGEAKDIDYMTKLALMKGHLIVAKELLDLKKPEQAEPHIGHPVEEIYADVEEQLNERKVPAFKESLVALQDEIKAGAKSSAKVDSDFKASMQAVDGAIAVLPATQRQSPSFVLQVINGLLDTASAEYSASISDGKISQLIEYQDSRGFVIYAQELLKGLSGSMGKGSAKSAQEIEVGLQKILKTWPSVVAPAKPVNTSEQLTAMIKAIEQSSQATIGAPKS